MLLKIFEKVAQNFMDFLKEINNRHATLTSKNYMTVIVMKNCLTLCAFKKACCIL